MSNLMVNSQVSPDAILYYRLKVVQNLSIAALIFCFIVPVGGIAGILAITHNNIKVEIFTCGMILGMHTFWVPIIVSSFDTRLLRYSTLIIINSKLIDIYK